MISNTSSIVILPSNCFLSFTTGIASKSYFDIIFATSLTSSLTFTKSTLGIYMFLTLEFVLAVNRSFKDNLPSNLFFELIT